MAECVRDIKKLAPEATMDTMALPYGGRPRDRKLIDVLLQGTQGGTSYANLCVLDAWGGPNPSPISKKFNRREILRIGAEPGYIESWIKTLKGGGDYEPYVSDGDLDTVSVPKRAAKQVDKSRLAGVRLSVYEDGTGTRLAWLVTNSVPS